MQQACVDDVLMSNYTELNDTASLNNMISRSVNEVNSFRCEPFNCNDHGSCSNGSCVCYTGTSLYLLLNAIAQLTQKKKR